MKEQLKNCPRCGGTLDDNGRCTYCNSKVYDLTDINIDVNSHDRIKLKLKCGENTVVMECYPASLTWDIHNDYLDCRSFDGAICYMRQNPIHTIKLELISV